MNDRNKSYGTPDRRDENKKEPEISGQEKEFSKVEPEQSFGEKNDNRTKKQDAKKSVTLFKKILSVVSDIFFWGLCLVILSGSLMFVLSDNTQKSFFGYRIYNVLTASMTPSEDGNSPPGGFREGDLIIVKLCDPKEIQVGDIITYNPDSNDETVYLTHRVIEVKYEMGGTPGIYFITQGDVNSSPDPPINSSMLIGKKVFHIPYMGQILESMRNNIVLSILTVLSFFSLLFILRWYFSATPTEVPTENGTDGINKKKKTTWTMRPGRRKR